MQNGMALSMPGLRIRARPKPQNPKPLNPQTLNPKRLDPKTLNPKKTARPQNPKS